MLIDTPDGRYCARHDRQLKRGEVCHACVADPVVPGQAETSDQLDRELLASSLECQTRERLLWRRCSELLEDGTPQDYGTAAKLSAESAKWARLSREIKGEVAQRRQLRELEKHEKAMQGQRGGGH